MKKFSDLLFFLLRKFESKDYQLVAQYDFKKNIIKNNYTRFVLFIKPVNIHELRLKLSKFYGLFSFQRNTLTYYRRFLEIFELDYIEYVSLSLLKEGKNIRLSSYFSFKENTPKDIRKACLLQCSKLLSINLLRFFEKTSGRVELIGMDACNKFNITLKVYERYRQIKRSAVIKKIEKKYRIAMSNLLNIINLDFYNTLLIVKKYNVCGELSGTKLDLPFTESMFKSNILDERLKLKEALFDKDKEIKIVSLNIDEKLLKTINLYYN